MSLITQLGLTAKLRAVLRREPEPPAPGNIIADTFDYNFLILGDVVILHKRRLSGLQKCVLSTMMGPSKDTRSSDAIERRRLPVTEGCVSEQPFARRPSHLARDAERS